MKQSNFLRFAVNLVLYTAVIFALYLIYSPLNNHPKNKTGSSTQFIYQQF